MKPPYVLVAHSLGSLESLLITDRHRDKVAGMVLIDPTLPDQGERMAKVAPGLTQFSEASRAGLVAAIRQCAERLRGAPSDRMSVAAQCAQLPSSYPPALRQAVLTNVTSRGAAEAVASFMDETPQSYAASVNPTRNYGDMPLVIMTATEPQPLPPMAPPEIASEMVAFMQDFSRGHDELAALSTRGVNVRVPHASHYIHQIKPQVVIDAVAAVIAESRRGTTNDRTRA
jgi:pimeloyl-ACP methyl ester carboxylesterase